MILFLVGCFLWFVIGIIVWYRLIFVKYRPLESADVKLKTMCMLAYMALTGPIGILYGIVSPWIRGK